MSGPIRPDEVSARMARRIPEFVFALADAVMARAPADVTRSQVYAERWLRFETAYREAGWGVTYDKPAFDENYEPRFVFRAPARKE